MEVYILSVSQNFLTKAKKSNTLRPKSILMIEMDVMNLADSLVTTTKQIW